MLSSFLLALERSLSPFSSNGSDLMNISGDCGPGGNSFPIMKSSLRRSSDTFFAEQVSKLEMFLGGGGDDDDDDDEESLL
mgnify:CR=1 FL=1